MATSARPSISRTGSIDDDSWAAYDRWLQDQPATRDWANSFLAAFATAGGLTVATFDQELRTKARSAILLRPAADAAE